MNKKPYILSIDMETLNAYDDAVILSIGLCCVEFSKTACEIGANNFQWLVDKSIEFKLDTTDQIQNYKRTVRKKELDWWREQSPEAKEVLKKLPTDIKLSELPKMIEQFLNHQGIGWQGVTLIDRRGFDIWKLQHVMEENLEYPRVPWDYREQYEFSSIFSILTGDRYANIKPSDVEGMIYHNAKYDATLDMYRLFNVLVNTNYWA